MFPFFKKTVKTKAIVTVVTLIALLVGAWAIVSQKPQAPAIGLTTLQGKPIGLAELRGKVVLVNFWATSCTTCMAEMPKLVELQNKLSSKGYQTVSIAMDYDPPEYVKAYVAQKNLPFIVAMDRTGEAAKAFGGIRLTPSSFLIDKQGHIVQSYLGAPDFVRFEALVEDLLRQA